MLATSDDVSEVRVVLTCGLDTPDRERVERWRDGASVEHLAGDELRGRIGADLALVGSDGDRAKASQWVSHLCARSLLVLGVGARTHVGAALRAGCDDYVASLIDAHELTARVEARLTRASTRFRTTFGELVLIQARQDAAIDGQLLGLRVSEYRLLLHLMLARGKPLSSSEIVRCVLLAHGDGGSARTLVWELRRRLRQSRSGRIRGGVSAAA